MTPHHLACILLMAAIGATSTLDSANRQPTAEGLHASIAGESSIDQGRVTVRGASPSQLARLEEAIRAYSDAGLELPSLEIQFFEDEASCGGPDGRFRPSGETWRIEICSTSVGAVYEHELAHAWELAHLTQHQRRLFMRMRGHSNWSDRDRPWRERGKEDAALVIQQGLSGLPLPPVLGREAVSRLRAYELLTGTASPLLIDWLAARDAPCDERPTPMGAWFPDRSGLTCHRQLAMAAISR